MSLWTRVKAAIPSKDHRLNYYEWPAYLFDLYRIAPRVVFALSTYGMWKVMYWYMYGIQTNERTAEVSAFVGVIAAAYTKGLDYYMQRGVDWSKRMQLNGGEAGGASVDVPKS